jgi:hypothetical protein
MLSGVFLMGQFLGSVKLRCRGVLTSCALFTLAAVGGCDDGGPPRNTDGLQNLQPVSGTVSFQGKPTPGAVVLFHPADDPDSHQKRIAGIVDEEGAFEMSTTVSAGTRPGVEPGTYKVSITWAEPINPNDRDSDMGPDLLPVKYKDHTTSGFEVEIGTGNNELEPFEPTP